MCTDAACCGIAHSLFVLITAIITEVLDKAA